MDAASLLLTLELDGESFARFDELRRHHYPAERNRVPAHLTLFHRLPGAHDREIRALLRRVAAGQKPIDLGDPEVKLTERGVAAFFRSPQLLALRAGLTGEWRTWLTDPDQASFQPHVTIQSGIASREAQATRREVAAGRLPRTVRSVGLHLWRYRNGAWEDMELFRFRR